MADEEMVNGTQQSSLTQEKKGTPRLMITEMVLENFKSYAGVQRVGPFHKVGRDTKHFPCFSGKMNK